MPANVNLNIDINKKGEGDKEAAVGLEAVAKSADNAKDQLAQLDRKLLETRAAMVAAGKTFAETGDISPLKSLLKDERELNTAIKSISRGTEAIAKDIVKAGDDGGKGFIAKLTSAGIDGAKGLIDNLQGQFKTIALKPTGLTQWLVAGAVAASPIIGAAVGAAVTLGVGGGVLAAGIVAASKDPRVSSAWGSVFSNAGAQLKSESSVFVLPLTQAATTVGAEFGKVIPKIGADFAALAPRIESLGVGASKLIDNVFKGGNFDRVVALAGKLFDQLSAEMPNLGNAISNMLGSVAAGGPGIQQFWSDFLTSTEKTVVGIGNVTEALSKTYDFLGGKNSIGDRINNWADEAGNGIDKFLKSVNDNIGGRLNDQFDKAWHIDRGGSKKKEADDLSTSVDKLRQQQQDAAAAASLYADSLNRMGLGAQLASGDFTKLSSQINATAMTTDTLAASMAEKVLNTTLAADQATLSFATAERTLKDDLVKGKDALDIHSAAGEKNRSAVLNAVAANIQQYHAQIAAGVSAQDAAASYDANTQALERQMKKAGLTQAQIDGLIGKYKGVPATVDTNIQMYGIQAAINNLGDLIAQINGVPDYKRITIEEAHRITYDASTPPSQYFKGNAAGGVYEHAAVGLLRDASVFSAVSSGARYAFAEPSTGGEAFVPRYGDYGRSMGILNRAAGWYGARVVSGGGAAAQITLSFDAQPGTLEHAILSLIRAHVVNSGGDVQAALGRRGH